MMKKCFITILMAMTIVLNLSAAAIKVGDRKIYNFKPNTAKLAEYLGLTQKQSEDADKIMSILDWEMTNANHETNDSIRKVKTTKALTKNAMYMRHILSKDQNHKYLMVLNATVQNRKIEIGK